MKTLAKGFLLQSSMMSIDVPSLLRALPLCLFLAWTAMAQQTVSDYGNCGFPGAPAHSAVTFNSGPVVKPGTVARYTCDRGFELLGPARRICGVNGTWTPQGIPFCGTYRILN